MINHALARQQWNAPVGPQQFAHVTLGRVLDLFAPYRWRVLAVLACIIVSALLGIAPSPLPAGGDHAGHRPGQWLRRRAPNAPQ